jgi:hypothetical protein
MLLPGLTPGIAVSGMQVDLRQRADGVLAAQRLKSSTVEHAMTQRTRPIMPAIGRASREFESVPYLWSGERKLLKVP